MKKTMLFAILYGASVLLAGNAYASEGGSISNGEVKIGVLTDMSGVYKTNTGPGSVTAARMAVEDFGGSVLGKPIEVIVADHQNKADIGSSIARQWIDEDHVDMITGLGNSAVGVAVQNLASDKHVITINTGAGTVALTEKQCTRYGLHYVYDTYSVPTSTATAVVDGGGDSWFFITANYSFGHSLQQNATNAIEAAGGKVIGSAKHPIGTDDFASYLIQAQASGAKVIGLADAGRDFINAVKQANAFGIIQHGQKIAGMLVYINDIKALGLPVAQGLEFTTAFYWNQSEAARKWSQRFFERHHAMPNMNQAGTYSAVMAYLKAIKKAGTDNADQVRKALGDTPINDMFVSNGRVEPNGLMVHDMFLVKVKSPDQSHGDWDLLKVVSKVPADKAFIPLSRSSCPLLEK